MVVLSQSDFDALQRSAGKPSKDNSNFIDHLLAIPKRPPSKRSSPRLQGVQGSQKEKEAFEVEFPRLEITLREVDFS